MTLLNAVVQTQAPHDDDTLVSHVLSGDLDAFEAIVRRHNQRIFRLVRSVIKNDGDAEDVVQEAYVRAYSKLATYRGPGKFGAWLGRIAVNEALDRWRSRQKIVFLEDKTSAEERAPHWTEIMQDDRPSPERLAMSQEIKPHIEDAIDTLPQEFRTVFMLRAVDGASTTETAEILDIPVATVKTRYHRARKLLRTHLDRELDIVAEKAFGFAGERCDRIVRNVRAAIAAAPDGTKS